MKKLLFVLFFIPVISFAQEKKYIKPIVIFDLPVHNGAMNGLSTNVGALFGNENFVQIGLLVGYRQHSMTRSFFGPNHNLGTVSILWKVQFDKIIAVPMFSYANGSYQDLSIRFGYAFDKSKTSFVHLFTSTQMGLGIGTTVCIK